jgi:hypothetical protein
VSENCCWRLELLVLVLCCSALLRGGPLRCDAMDEPLRGLEGV